MRVSTATSSRSDSRMFTVVVQGYGSAHPRNAERTISVPFSRLQALMQSISQIGGTIVSVTPPLRRLLHLPPRPRPSRLLPPRPKKPR